MKTPPLRVFGLFLALLALIPAEASATNYTITMVNNTGLDPSKYTIYAMGYSTSSNLVMNSSGVFVTQSSGTISSYPLGTGAGQISTISLDTATAFTGGRLYFFMVPNGSPAPTVAFGSQPTNPPDTAYPPYTIVEITVPANSPATIDVQTVDGFVFPLTITLNNQINVVGQQYGQPVYTTGQTGAVNRADIFTAYTNFMTARGTSGQPYLDMIFNAGSIDGQAGGILNPGAYLSAVDSTNQYVNLGSTLNTQWNTGLGTLFGTTTLEIQGVASAAGDSGTPIAADTYKVTSIGNQTYPGTTVSLPALQFTGDTTSSNVFDVFNPVGIAIATNDAGTAITGTISGNKLTLDSAVTGLQNNMYVIGAGIGTPGGQTSVQVTDASSNPITLNQSLGTPAPHSQYLFSKLPYGVMFQTPGQMVFGNSGVFADNTIQFTKGSASSTVLGNLEYQIVAALNRGVALNATALNPGTNGGTSAVWGDQTHWYPLNTTENLFSLFMHVGQSNNVPIFFQPANAASWLNAQGQTMGAAYGFAFDENGGPVPPAPSGQPEVPSKFDQNVPVGASIQINFGPWGSSSPAGPQITVSGKNTIRTSENHVTIRGTAVGGNVFVKFRNKAHKVVTKRIGIRPNGRWQYVYRLQVPTTVLRFYSLESDGASSGVKKIKVVKID